MKLKSIYYDDESYNLITNEFPFFIAHEYKRLYDLLNEEEYIGAFFEIKDVLEIILKLPVLQICAFVEHRHDLDESEKSISCIDSLLVKPLSLGDWHINCRTMFKLLQSNGYPNESIQILKNLFQFYNKNNIVAWRNDSIGHGAFFLDLNVYLKEVNKYLELVTDFLMTNQASYLAMPVFADDHSLKGADWPMKKEKSLENMKVTGIFMGEEYEISPYIMSNCNYFYFFDSYMGARHKTSLLDYIHGNKNKAAIDYFQKKYMNYVKTGAIQNDSQVIGSVMKIKDDDFLNMLHYEREYVRSDELEKCFLTWVDGKQYDRGVFLLKMNRGMGKTAFVSNHDPLVNLDAGFEVPDDLSLRSYYCSRQSYRSIYDFISTCNEALFSKSAQAGESYRSSEVELPRINPNSSDYKQQMCDYLEGYLKIYQDQMKEYERICLIIDGLDEIPVVADADNSIFDFVPTPDMLPKGVYIILTSRIGDDTDEMIPDSIRQRIENLVLTDQLVIRRKDVINVENMKHFLQEKWQETLSEDTKDQIVEMAEYNFVNLKLMTEMAHLKSTEEILGASSEEIFDLYAKSLHKQYGNKRYRLIQDLLFVIASEQEALTLDEISFLMGYDELTYDFLGVLRDVQALIKIERSINGNRYSLANETHRKRILVSFAGRLPGLLRRWIDNILAYEELEEESDELIKEMVEQERRRMLRTQGMSYLMAYILKYVEMLTPESLKQEIEKEINCLRFATAIMDYEMSYECMNYGHRGISRDCCMNNNVISICQGLENQDDQDVIITLGQAYNCLALQYGGRFNHYRKAIPYCRGAVEVASRMEECDDKDIELGKIYNNLCYYMVREGSYSFDEITEVYLKSIDHRKRYKEKKFFEGVERYMVTLESYLAFLVRNNALERGLKIHQEINALYDEIREQYPEKPFALILKNRRYEYGYECLKIMADNSYGVILTKQYGPCEEAKNVFAASLKHFREMDKETECFKMTTLRIRYCQTLFQYGRISFQLEQYPTAIEAFDELLEALLKMGREEQSFKRDEFMEFVEIYRGYLENTDPKNEKMKQLKELEGYL